MNKSEKFFLLLRQLFARQAKYEHFCVQKRKNSFFFLQMAIGRLMKSYIPLYTTSSQKRGNK